MREAGPCILYGTSVPLRVAALVNCSTKTILKPFSKDVAFGQYFVYLHFDCIFSLSYKLFS